MGDDLFRRKVAGKVVTVRCRHCSAEISVDASDSDPRPLPPRPPRPGALEGRLVALSPGFLSTPDDARAESNTLKGLKSPEPASALVPEEEPTGIEDEFVEELPPSVPAAAADEAKTETETEAKAESDTNSESEHERVSDSELEPALNSQDFLPPPEPPEPISEPPPSSSGTPSLHALTSHAPEPRRNKRDEFDLAFGTSSSTVLGLGPPTIDVSNLPTRADDEPSPLSDRRGAPTMPLFDMSTGLDPIPEEARSEPEAPPPPRKKTKRKRDSAAPSSSSEKRTRDRKKVVAPPTAVSQNRSEPPERKGGSLIWAAVAVIGVAGGGAWFLRDRGGAPAQPPEPAVEAPAAVVQTTAAAPAPLPAPAVPEPAATQEAPIAAQAAPPSVAALETAPQAKAAVEAKPDKPQGETPAAASPTPAPASSAQAAPPASPAEAPAEAATEAPEVTDPFNKGAAVAALNAAAAEAATCRKPGDPTGTANVVVTFAPSGRVTTANISGIFAGTPTGGCVAAKLRKAKVPPFAGEYTTVGKTVVIQ